MTTSESFILLGDGEEPAVGQEFDVPIEHLVLKPPVSAGMDLDIIIAKVPLYRGTRRHEGPAPVRRRAGLPAPYWELSDGRHRLFGAVIGGRPVLRCKREE